MVIDFSIEGDLEVQLALRKGESLGDQRAGKTTAAAGGSILEFLDSQGNG